MKTRNWLDLVRRAWTGLRRWDARVLRRLGPRARRRVRVARWAVLLSSPVWLLNLTVGFVGRSVVFPLSPFFLREKVSALTSYAEHRALCWWTGHAPVEALTARAERRHRLPRGLLAAVVQVESAGIPHRISSA